MLRRRVAVVVVALGLGLVAAGCGSSSSGGGGSYVEPSGPPVATETVQAGNLWFKPTAITVPQGIIQFTLTNTQSGVHSFVIRGVPGFMLEVSGQGDSQTKKVELKPGTYTYYCNIPGHEQAGMKGTLTVTG